MQTELNPHPHVAVENLEGISAAQPLPISPQVQGTSAPWQPPQPRAPVPGRGKSVGIPFTWERQTSAENLGILFKRQHTKLFPIALTQGFGKGTVAQLVSELYRKKLSCVALNWGLGGTVFNASVLSLCFTAWPMSATFPELGSPPTWQRPGELN